MSAKTAKYWHDRGFKIRAGERAPCRNSFGTPVFFRDQVEPWNFQPRPKRIIEVNGRFYREI